jgi:NAD-dependent histone deacetylase SIR2
MIKIERISIDSRNESNTVLIEKETKTTKKKIKQPIKKILQDSNKINKMPMKSIKPVKKSTLQLNKSTVLNTVEMREKIAKLANDESKGLKYFTFKEFEDCEAINKQILSVLNKSKKIVILTGAGISCNAGIPDFRSDNGLYNKKLKENEFKSTIKGKDMFDVSVYRSFETIQIFNNFIYELYQQVLNSKPTLTHEFIKKLQDKNKLIKCYTQNIDGLERNCGLKTEFECSEWNETNVIQLHGDLHQLCCNYCKFNYKWDEIYDEFGNIKFIREEPSPIYESNEESDNDEDLMILSQTSIKSTNSINSTFSIQDLDNNSISSIEGGENEREGNKNELTFFQHDDDDNNYNKLIECPKCINNYENKMKLGKRCLESSIGIIRPNIVLYGEEHPYSESFAKNLNKDLNKKPNVLLIFGTSLKVAGVKNLVKKLSKKIHESDKGMVILINKDPISYSSWKNYIDYQIVSDCDAFCKFVEDKLPNIFA